MIGLEAFVRSISFKPQWTGWMGLEREGYLVNAQGLIIPHADQVLARIPSDHPFHDRFGYEFPRSQIESRTPPAATLSILRTLVLENEAVLGTHLKTLDLTIQYTEVAPATMPYDIYPDPLGRYQQLQSNMSAERLRAACRVAGTHVHIGMPDLDTALRVYNGVIKHLVPLIRLGDQSNGERLRLYREVAPDYFPPPYQSVCDFHRTAVTQGYDTNLRNCWHLIRITRHGTIEFRMFGANQSIDQTLRWAAHCQRLCQQYF